MSGLTAVGSVAALNAISGGQWYLQLHLGPPGPDGTLQAAPNAARAPIHFGAPIGTPTRVSSDGTTTADGSAVSFGTWDGAVFPLTDFVSHWSLWNDPAAGACYATGVFGGIDPQVTVCTAADDRLTTPAGPHGYAIGDYLQLDPLAGLPMPAGLASDTGYVIVNDGFTTAAFSISTGVATDPAIDITGDGVCAVQKIVAKLVNTGDTVRVGNGEIVLYLE